MYAQSISAPTSTIKPPRLTLSARVVLAELERRARRHAEVWIGNKALASLLGLAERTVKAALRSLQAAGLVDVVRDYTLKVRRRIRVLAYLEADQVDVETTPERPARNPSVRAHIARRSGPNLPPAPPSPSDSPLVGPENEESPEDDDTTAPDQSPAEPTPEPAGESSSSRADSLPYPESLIPEKYRPGPDGKRPATPEEVRKMHERAAGLFGRTPATRLKVAALARMSGAHAVKCALAAAEEAHERDGRITWGYVARVLVNFAREGGPPEPPPPPSPLEWMTEEQRREWIEARLAAVRVTHEAAIEREAARLRRMV